MGWLCYSTDTDHPGARVVSALTATPVGARTVIGNPWSFGLPCSESLPCSEQLRCTDDDLQFLNGSPLLNGSLSGNVVSLTVVGTYPGVGLVVDTFGQGLFGEGNFGGDMIGDIKLTCFPSSSLYPGRGSNLSLSTVADGFLGAVAVA